MVHRPGHKRKKEDITITGVEKTLRRREARKAGGDAAAQTAAVTSAEQKARNTPSFRKLKAGDPIPGEGVDPGTAQQGTFRGTAKELAAEKGVDVSKVQSTGIQSQIDIKNQEGISNQQQLIPDPLAAEISKAEPNERAILTKFLIGPRPRPPTEEEAAQGGTGIPGTGVAPIPGLAAGNVAGSLLTGTGQGAATAVRIGLRTAGRSLRVSPKQKIIARERSLQSIMRKTKVPRQQAEEISKIYERANRTKLHRLLDPFNLRNASTIQKITVVGGVMTISGSLGIASWYALDNIISGTSVFLRDVVNDVSRGNGTYEEAITIFDEHQDDIDRAKLFVTTASIINPGAWPIAFFYINGVKQQQNLIDGQRDRLENFRGANTSQGLEGL